jgi:hypothetical protein
MQLMHDHVRALQYLITRQSLPDPALLAGSRQKHE